MPGAAELRTLRRRIRSVSSTQKITRSFELIAASRIARARRAVEEARPYAEHVGRVIADLSTEQEAADHPLLQPRERQERTGILVISSDRGLAGAYNTSVVRKAERLARRQRSDGLETELYTIGRKAEGYFRFREIEPRHTWQGISDRPSYEDARGVARAITEEFTEGRIDRLWMVYTEFRSALTQVPQEARLLPVEREESADDDSDGYPPVFMFEPDPASLLDQLIPRYVEQRVFAGLLEAAASEHASRQRAMKAATDNANEVLDDLKREANRARQAAITTEISEIVGGAEALSQA